MFLCLFFLTIILFLLERVTKSHLTNFFFFFLRWWFSILDVRIYFALTPIKLIPNLIHLKRWFLVLVFHRIMHVIQVWILWLFLDVFPFIPSLVSLDLSANPLVISVSFQSLLNALVEAQRPLTYINLQYFIFLSWCSGLITSVSSAHIHKLSNYCAFCFCILLVVWLVKVWADNAKIVNSKQWWNHI